MILIQQDKQYCLISSCDWNVDVGTLVQTITFEETECGKLCRTVTADAFVAFSEVTVCFELTSEGYLKGTVTQKYCSYSRSDGWTCTTKSKTNTNTDISFDIYQSS